MFPCPHHHRRQRAPPTVVQSRARVQPRRQCRLPLGSGCAGLANFPEAFSTKWTFRHSLTLSFYSLAMHTMVLCSPTCNCPPSPTPLLINHYHQNPHTYSTKPSPSTLHTFHTH